MDEETTCPLAIVENRRKAKILEDMITQIELEEKYPGYLDGKYDDDMDNFLEKGEMNEE